MGADLQLYPFHGRKVYFIAMVILALFYAGNTYAQLSPGDLTKAHANLEGLKNCTACHEIGEKITNDKCLDCHKEIKTLINKNAGYHSSNDVKNKLCSKCHSEHNGRNFQIIHFDENKFDHAITGFILTGKHVQNDCKKCHRPEFIKNADLKKRKNTFLGLKTNCSNCHDDVHQKTLGNNCENCHNTEAFKPAALFNHDKARFKLTGLHTKVDCEKCHKKETRKGREFQRFTGLSFNNCSTCHADIHKGKFGKNCESCHNTSGFKNVRTASFDHNMTNFPLTGRHKNLKCADCHGTNLASKLRYSLCTDCHKDFHKGQFTKNNIVRDCNECHTVNGFSPSTFTIERHSSAKFTLTGSHLAVACKNCHRPAADWTFVFDSEKCVSCHKNVHGSEITKAFLGDNACEGCHNTISWDRIKFDHSRTKFALTGKHKSTDCRNCHTYKLSDNKTGYKFVSLKSGCENCHNDIHLGQFISGGQNDCTSCHVFENWKPVKFDHEKTEFSLKGAHSKLKCIQCHKPAVKNGVVFIKYKLEEFKCANCHTS